jgi:hypothetical protein
MGKMMLDVTKTLTNDDLTAFNLRQVNEQWAPCDSVNKF